MNLVNTSDASRADNRQLKIADRLLRAIAQHELKLAYQPEIDLISRKVISLEALCRWQDTELGQVAPDEFIGVAEAKGLIVQIGEYLLQKVLEDLPTLLKRWPTVRVPSTPSSTPTPLPLGIGSKLNCKPTAAYRACRLAAAKLNLCSESACI